MATMYPKGNAPQWACDALRYAGIDVSEGRIMEEHEIPTEPAY